jgi:hypothetical protein
MERARNEFKAGLEKDKMKNRSTLQKILDGFVTTEREIKLTSPITIGKLTMAALHRVTTGVPEEILGGALSKILPKTITENSRNEAGFNVKMEAKAWTKGFMEGIKDSGKTIALKRTGKFSFGFKHGGKSDIEVAYGKHGLMPPEISHFFGHIHGALKAPVKRLAFERSVLKQSEWYIKHNINPNDPVIAMKIGLDAYKEGNRSIFMQDNAVSTAFTVFFRGLENNKVAPTSGKIIAAAGKFFMPFIKIPTNLVSETGNYAFGLIPGSIHLAKIGISKALGKGIEDLPPEQADMVMRNFKKGTLGAGVLLLGFFGYQNVGGYYQDHEKRKEGDVKAGGVRIFGYDPPNWALHNPLLECLQIGATARRVFDHYTGLNETKKKDYSPTMQATSASLTGLAKELPMVDQPIRVYKGIFGSDYEKSRFWGELLKSSTEPAMIQKAANWFDDRKVDPKTIWEYEKSGIPGLKNTLEEKHFKSEEPSVNYYHSKD